MKIPRYWKQVYMYVDDVKFNRQNYPHYSGEGADIYAWGYSDRSESEALKNANQRLNDIVKVLSSNADEDFYYPFNVIREEILERINEEEGLKAIITRNRYYSQVLNTEQLMFVDIDLPYYQLKEPSFFQRLFGKAEQITKENELKKAEILNSALAKVEAFVANTQEAGFRIYRTFAGLRLIATHKAFDANSEESQQILDALGADPLYQKLCRAQQCYRARLTPKFWRMGLELGYSPRLKIRQTPEMMSQWVKDDQERLEEFDKWIAEYESIHTKRATCEYLKSVGNTKIDNNLLGLIELHDRVTQAESGLPLA